MSYIALIAGARPNFMKVDPVLRALKQRNIPARLIHTGQHYDKNMSEVFFKELEIQEPDANLGAGSGSHSEQTAAVMLAYEQYCLNNRPLCTVVVGDVNSTIACSLVSAKMGIKVCHVEAGLRSRDWTMPEEINRVLTDRLADILFTPSLDGNENLLQEGIEEKKIFFVGNVMIDTLLRLLPRAKESSIHEKLNLDPGAYILVTLHRPSNVDGYDNLKNVVEILLESAERKTVVFPAHPRTVKQLDEFDLLSALKGNPRIKLMEPIGYLDFLALNASAAVVLTDSGGIQEETTVLRVPCLTYRENTERPITISTGTNELVGTSRNAVIASLDKILSQGLPESSIPELWDGKAGERCADILERFV